MKNYFALLLSGLLSFQVVYADDAQEINPENKSAILEETLDDVVLEDTESELYSLQRKGELQAKLSTLEEEIDALKHWQGKFKGQIRHFTSKANRWQYRNVKEAQMHRANAREAQDNFDALNENIKDLVAEREKILDELQE